MNLSKVLFLATALIASSAFSQQLVVPAGLENVEGNDALAVPITAPFNSRSQTRYDSASFAAPTLITALAYRLDDDAGDINFLITDIQVTLSTFAGTTLSTTFASNLGSDQMTVFGRGSLAVVMSAAGSPNPFDLVINFNSPFAYNPADGDLLVDIRKFSGEFRAENFDSQTTSSTATIYADSAAASNGLPLSEIYVTRFTTVPEPNALGIVFAFCIGLSTRSLIRNRTRQSARS